MSRYRESGGFERSGDGKSWNAALSRRSEERLERMQVREDYEYLCRQFKRMAEEKGFIFPSQIWLKEIKTGRIYKNG